MAEVGVLNLEVNANTGPAEEKLVKLADALKRVKEAVSGGLKLSGVARQVKSIADAVNDNISDSTISKIGRLADELSKLKGFENVRINIKVNNAISGAIEELETGYEQVQEYNDKLEQVGATVSSAKDSVDNFSTSVNRANEVIQNMSMQNDGWMAWFDLFKQKLNDFLRMRSAMALGAGPETGLATSWKNGAIEAEGTVTDACEVIEGAVSGTCESINNNLEGTRQVLLESGENGMRVFSSLEEAATYYGVSIDDIKRKLQATYDTVYGQRNQMNVFTSMEEAACALGITVDEVKQKLQETYDRIYGVQKAAPTPEISNAVTATADKAISNSSTAASNAVNRVKNSVDSLIRNTSKVRLLTSELETLKGKLQGIIDTNGTQEEMDKVLKKILQVKEALKKEKVSNGLFTDLKNTIKNIFPMIADLLHRLKNAAIRRAMNTILRGLWSGLKEGVQNVYEYSKAIGSSFAPAMDSAASSILQMKNSLGAAVAPLIQSIIPYLQIVVKWFIDAVNWANQFISLMRGQSTWTRAVPATATAFGKQEKAAKGAAAAVKDLLADWDELNIIQSETSGAGSGAGTSAAEDYLNMFEEVGTFDNGVKKVVDYIKDNFDDILKIAELVGAAVLTWKISNAFAGVLGMLASFVAAGALIDLEWRVSTLLNDQYLKTGDIGWLVADVLKTLIGGVLMKKILGTVLKGEYAYLGIPIMLTVNAAARTVAVLSDPNVSALSREALVSNLTSALEGGAVAGYLMKTAGFATKTAIGGGTAVALVTFGVLTGLKADVEAVQSGEINDEYIKGKALEALSIGLGTALIAKLLVPGVSTAKALGFGAATGVGAVLVTIGATLGIQAYVEAVNSGITEEAVKKAALSSLAMGVGGALFAKMAGASLLASLGIGGLVALGTVATIGAAVGITALLTTSKEKIKWGSERLTEDQVKAFVNEKIFDVNLPVAINLVKGKIEDTKLAEEDLETKAGDILPVINTLMLGFDIAGSLKQLEAEMFGDDGLVSQFRETVKAKQIEVEASLTLVPIKTENGEDMSATYLMQINEGWSKIDGIMGTLGKQLADAMKEAYDSELNGNLNEMAVKTVADVSRTMLEISTAITTAHSTNEMKKSFNEGLENLSGKGIQDILDFYKEQKKATTDVMSEAYEVYFSQLDDQRLTNEILLQKALENNGEYAGHTVEYYQGEIERIKSMYSDLEKMRSASIDAAIAFFESGDGLTQVREAILKAILEAPEDINVNTGLIAMGWEGSGIASLLNPDGTMIEGAKEKVQELFSEILTSAYGAENARHIMDAVDAGAIKYGDIFNKEVIEMLTSKMKFENINESARESVRQQWISLLSEILGDKTGVDKVVSEAKEQMSTAAEEIVNAANPGTVAEEMNNGTGSPLGQYATDMENVVEQTQNAQQAINNLTLDTISFDTTSVQDSANVAASAIENMAKRIRDAFASLDGLSYSMDVNGNVYTGAMSVLIPVQQKAMGGFVRSGDLVMANENGNFEMMGKMGNQPVVANNQQIVNGISNGVAQANSGVESRLTTIERLLQRLLQKDFVARAVPDSRWGTHNAKSDAALERVIG